MNPLITVQTVPKDTRVVNPSQPGRWWTVVEQVNGYEVKVLDEGGLVDWFGPDVLVQVEEAPKVVP